MVVFGLNDPLRQYFSIYQVVSQREGERKEKGQMRVKMSKQPPPTPTARAVGPCPTLIQTSRTPPKYWDHICIIENNEDHGQAAMPSGSALFAMLQAVFVTALTASVMDLSAANMV